jgi:apolipoprotein N-acyltransferase
MRTYFLALVSGLVASTAFAPLAFWLSGIIGLSLWYYLLVKSKLSQRLVISYLFGLGLLLPAQYWAGIYVGNFPWIFLCFGQAIAFLLPALVVNRKLGFNQFAFGTSIVLTEFVLRTLPFGGFGWTRIGFTQIDGPLSPIYAVGGTVLVAFYIAAISATRSVKYLVALIVFGFVATLLPGAHLTGERTRVALIQGGVTNLGLEFNSKPEEVFFRHLNETGESLERNEVDLIIWPENAVDVDINSNTRIRDLIADKSTDLATPILAGGVTQSLPGPKNQSILFDPGVKQIYTKRYLTPFGEYIPLRSISDKLSKYSGRVQNFISGKEDIKFKINGAIFQTLICYEILSDKFRDEIDSDFLVVQTNNATFGDTPQLDQEMNIARVRAAESGRFVAYVSTTGVTSLIDNQGNVINQIPKFIPGTLIGEIQHAKGLTITAKFGKLLEPVAIAWLIAIVLIRRRRML